MEKEIMNKLKTHSVGLIFILVVSFSSLIISCKDQKHDITKRDAEIPAAVVTTLDSFPVLYIPIQDITNAFNSLTGKQIKKISFQFHFDGGATNGQPTLIGYTGKNMGVFIPSTAVITLQKTATKIGLPYPLNLGSIELTRPEYDLLLAGTTNPSPTYLIFIPTKSTTYPNSVTYKTGLNNSIPTSAEIKVLQFVNELKPSPPADPYL